MLIGTGPYSAHAVFLPAKAMALCKRTIFDHHFLSLAHEGSSACSSSSSIHSASMLCKTMLAASVMSLPMQLPRHIAAVDRVRIQCMCALAHYNCKTASSFGSAGGTVRSAHGCMYIASMRLCYNCRQTLQGLVQLAVSSKGAVHSIQIFSKPDEMQPTPILSHSQHPCAARGTNEQHCEVQHTPHVEVGASSFNLPPRQQVQVEYTNVFPQHPQCNVQTCAWVGTCRSKRTGT